MQSGITEKVKEYEFAVKVDGCEYKFTRSQCSDGLRKKDKNWYYTCHRGYALGDLLFVALGFSNFAIIDACDIDLLRQHTWCESNGYAITFTTHERAPHLKQVRKAVHKMHRMILMRTDAYNSELQVDHINRVRLDNRRSNLRMVTAAQNALNKSVSKRNTSGVTGVSFNKKYGTWVATFGKLNARFGDRDQAIAKRREWERDAELYLSATA